MSITGHLDKPLASLSCAILGSQHNWGLVWGGNSVLKLIMHFSHKELVITEYAVLIRLDPWNMVVYLI